MKRQAVMVLEGLKFFLFLLVVILWGVNSVEAQTIGKTIDKSNFQEYKALLIPSMLRGMERGDYPILQTGNLNFPYRHWDRFLTASEKNAGKFDVNKEGDLVEKDTGKIPRYNIYGYPFPHIDPKDPDVAVKIIWNYNFQKYRLMGIQHRFLGYWVPDGSKRTERYIAGPGNLIFLQGRPPGQELKNPQGILAAEIGGVEEPMSLKGVNTLSLDFMDEREISVFNYIPAIRRTRQTSGVSRSDPYMGSDGWLDLYFGWAGKNRSMTWKLAGEKTILVPFMKTTKDVIEETPDRGMVFKWPHRKWGFEEKDWKGANWAFTDTIYVPRWVWVIEQFPKNPYYNWGLHINYVDKETSVIFQKEVFTRGGEFKTLYASNMFYAETPNGNNTVGAMASNMVADLKIRHAYTVTFPYYACFVPSSGLGLDYFNTSNLIQLSK